MRNLAASLFLVFFSCSAQCTESVTEYKAVLLQPSSLFHERVSNVDALAKYIKAIGVAIKGAAENAGEKTPNGGSHRQAQKLSAYIGYWRFELV